MMYRSDGHHGLTLLEMLLTLAVFSIVAILANEIYIGGFTTFASRTASLRVIRDNLIASQAIERTVRASSAIVNYPEVTPTEWSDADTLILKLPSIAANGDLIPATFDTVIFRRKAGEPEALEEETIANGPGRTSGIRVIVTTVRSLTFHYDTITPTTATRVTMVLSTTAMIRGRPTTYTNEITTLLRNL